ncbi:MAG: hypothetical protein WBA74_09340 [Cyclobacteriaceae bacterium]
MIFKLTFSALILSGLLFGCSEQTEKLQDAELSQEARTKRFMDALVSGTEKENVLVKSYYDKMDDSFKSKMSFKQYYADLHMRYSKVITQLKEGFQSFDRNIDPELQADQLRASLMEKEGIPEWYQNFRNQSKDKLLEAANGN